MANNTRMIGAQYAQQSSASDFTSTPGALTFLTPEAGNIITDQGYEHIERDYQRPDNEELPALRGNPSLEVGSFSEPVHGLSGGGAGDGVLASSLDCHLADLLESLLGTQTGATTGRETLGSPGTATDPALNGAWTAYRGMLIPTSAGYIAREARTATSTPTLDAALMDEDGGTVTPSASSVVYAPQSFIDDRDNPNHIHFFLDAELPESRRYFHGCMANGGLTIPGQAGAVMLNVSDIKATTWTNETVANPNYSEPSRGTQIVSAPVRVTMVDGTTYTRAAPAQFQAYDVGVDFGIELVPRRSDGFQHGVVGYAVTRIRPTITMKLLAGTMTSPRAVTESDRVLFEGSTKSAAPTMDLGIQIGDQPGAAMYIRMPTARIRSQRGDDNGLEVFEVTATAGVFFDGSAFRIHIF